MKEVEKYKFPTLQWSKGGGVKSSNSFVISAISALPDQYGRKDKAVMKEGLIRLQHLFSTVTTLPPPSPQGVFSGDIWG